MKRLILTENQCNKLKGYLLKEEEDKKEKLREFVKEVKKEFINTLSTNNIGDYVTFIFGDTDEDGIWNEESLSMVAFKILELVDNGIKLEYITDSGKRTVMSDFSKGDTFMLYPTGTNGIHFRGRIPQLGLKPLTENSKEIRIPKFLSFIVTDKSEKTNVIDAKRKAQDRWVEMNDKFNKEMIYKPSFLGLDNFFFYPRGYMSMDKILQKFGLSVEDNEIIKVRIKRQDIVGGGEKIHKNSIQRGKLLNDRFIINIHDVKFIFFIGKNLLATGGDYTLNVSYKKENETIKTTEQNNGKAEINVVKI